MKVLMEYMVGVDLVPVRLMEQGVQLQWTLDIQKSKGRIST